MILNNFSLYCRKPFLTLRDHAYNCGRLEVSLAERAEYIERTGTAFVVTLGKFRVILSCWYECCEQCKKDVTLASGKQVFYGISVDVVIHSSFPVALKYRV